MMKAVLAGTAALVVVGSTLVYAQTRPSRPEGFGRWQPNVEDMRAFGEARLAALKAGLMLTPEQERLWPAFEQAARTLGRMRIERMQALAEGRRGAGQRSDAPRTEAPRGGDAPRADAPRAALPLPADPIERLRQRGEVMAQTGIALQRLAEAADPLYKSLDENQKRRFSVLARMGGREMGGPGMSRFGVGGPEMGGSPFGRGFERGLDRGPRRLEFDGGFGGPRDRFGGRFGYDRPAPRSEGLGGRGPDRESEGPPRRGMPGEEDL